MPSKPYRSKKYLYSSKPFYEGTSNDADAYSFTPHWTLPNISSTNQHHVPISLKSAYYKDACEPFASVMVTPSEDDVIEDEGQLQMDPLAVDVAMQWRQRVRQRQERVQCDVCDKTFRLSVMLEVHKRNQCRAPSYTCDVCEKKFQKKSDLSTHSQSHHTTKSKARAKQPYGCVTCSSRFSELSSLLQHQRIHSSGYACHVCGKTFAKKSDQVLHTRIHTGEKPYQCHFCAKKFSLLSRIRKHWEVHGIPFKKNLYH